MIQNSSYLSFDAVLADLQTYLQGLDDYRSWIDFFESSTGQTMLEFMAGIGTMYNTRIDTMRREGYITEAQLQTSIYLIALALGYVPHRKTAPSFSIRMDVSEDVTLDRTDILATLSTYDVSVINDNTLIKKAIANAALTVGVDTNLVKAAGGNKAYFEDLVNSPFAGVSVDQEIKLTGANTLANDATYTVFSVTADKVEINEDFDTAEVLLPGSVLAALGRAVTVVLGTWKTYTKTILNSVDFEWYLLNSTNFEISSDIDSNGNLKYVFIDIDDGVTVTAQTVIQDTEEMITPTSVLVTTHFDGDVRLQFGDGILGAKPGQNHIVTVKALATPGQVLNVIDLSTSFTSSQAKITNIQPIAAGDMLTTGTNQEATKKVASLAPRHWASQKQGVTLKNCDVITARFAQFQDTKTRRTPGKVCELDIVYLMDPEDDGGVEHQLTTGVGSETEAFEGFFVAKHAMAATKNNLMAPTRKEVDFSMTVIHTTSSASATILIAIRAAIDDIFLKLGGSLFVGSLHKTILAITGVTRVYIDYPYEDKTLAFGEYFKRRNDSITFYTDATMLLEYKGDSDPLNKGYL